MVEFVSSVHKQIEDVVILDVEALCNLNDQLLKCFPNPLSNTQLLTLFNGILEKTTDGSVIRETLCRRQYVVLHGRYGRTGYLGREVTHLVFAKAKILLGFLEHDFHRPAHRVDPIGLKEREARIGGDKHTPFGVLVALGKEKTDIVVSEDNIDGDVTASELPAVLATFLWMVEQRCQGIGCVFLTLVPIFGASHLGHPQIAAFDMTRVYELDNFRAGEPTVSQDVIEPDAALDGTLYHLYHERDLAGVILLNSLGNLAVVLVYLTETIVKLILTETIGPCFPLLANQGIIKKHLAASVRNAKKQGFEAKRHLVAHMRENLADKLRLKPPLREIRIVNHQAYGIACWTRALPLNLVPKVAADRAEHVAPVIRLIGKETIENILLATEKTA